MSENPTDTVNYYNCYNYYNFFSFLVKKSTLALRNHEAILLSNYKRYLQKLEKMSGVLRKKRGDTRQLKEQEIELGELSVTCLCDLLTTHPYFNYSVNIASFLVPLLDNKHQFVREYVAKCISRVFEQDKQIELSLTVRNLYS